ncbi:jg8456 [Pararge aegeria aegeria]|uniref:Regulatory protein zeste n=1 Tax=Pararge aegeria aegeria TaxID=348720 RepID=A0A8S4QY00_9NEOP|nr:jg8456 [Pararge aegeria aegeria]
MDKKHVFTPTEKKLFVEILKKYGNIIENRDTDGASLKKKNDTWALLTAEFNSSPLATSKASTKQLRRLWVNLKQRQREALAKKRRQRLATRVGESEAIDPDVIVGSPALIYGIDSDTVQSMEGSSVPVKSNSPSVELVSVEPDVVIAPDDDYSNLSINMHLSLTSPSLFTRATPPPSALRTRTPSPFIFRTTSPPFEHQTASQINFKNIIMEREYQDSVLRTNEKHNLEVQILEEQLRESTAKADLAELILKQKKEAFDQVTV